MSLLDRANEFIQGGDFREETTLLLECVQAHNLDALVAVQRLYEDMYGGMTFNFELKAPAAFSLLCWGEAGLDALVEGLNRTRSTKNISLGTQILSSLAAGILPGFLASFVPGELAQIITESVRVGPSLADAARRHLTEFMVSLPDDDQATSVAAIGFQRLSISETDGKSAKELFAALATRWLVVGEPTIGEFRKLIAESPDNEPDFQAFFERVPQLLDPLAAFVWPRPDLHGAKEPDFIVKRADGTYLIIEIETPGKLLMTDAPQISAQVTQAVSQVMQYRSFLVQRSQEARQQFPDFRDPECLVVIGLERNLSGPQREALALENEHRRGLRIVGYDWIAERAERILRNMISANIAVRPVRMI